MKTERVGIAMALGVAGCVIAGPAFAALTGPPVPVPPSQGTSGTLLLTPPGQTTASTYQIGAWTITGLNTIASPGLLKYQTTGKCIQIPSTVSNYKAVLKPSSGGQFTLYVAGAGCSAPGSQVINFYLTNSAPP